MRLDGHGLVEMLAKMREIGVLAGGVDDQHQAVFEPAHHQIVDDAAIIVQQQRVAHTAQRQRLQIAGYQRFQRARRVTAQADLAHMRDVEKPSVRAGVQMLGNNAGRVLHRHLMAGERDHPRAARDVQLVQRRAPQRRRFG